MSIQEDKLREDAWKSSNLALFIWISCFFVAHPFVPGESLAKIVLDLLFSGVILLNLLAQADLPTPWRIGYTILGLLSVASTWIPAVGENVSVLSPLLYTLFLGLSIFIHFRVIICETNIGVDSLFGAACAYMMLGLFFAALFGMLGILSPGSFSISSDQSEAMGQMVYFSFITLTTVGYGDVVPVSRAAQMLAAYEAVIGQLFIAGIIGILVGTHVANAQRQRRTDD